MAVILYGYLQGRETAGSQMTTLSSYIAINDGSAGSKMKPTRTTNRLHFTDLSPERFEDLCLSLVYSLKPWMDIRHYGRVGSDGGVDIYAAEQLENGARRIWSVQCRRLKSAGLSQLKKAVDDTLRGSSTLPDVLLVVIGCDVRRQAHEGFIKYALEKGVGTSYLWTASNLEAKLFAERKDLLFAYFGVSKARTTRSREATIKRCIALKHRMRKDFLKSDAGYVPSARSYERFRCSEIFVRSIDDDSYPLVNKEVVGISGWFKIELFDFYFNGIEVMFHSSPIVMDCNGYWADTAGIQDYDKRRFKPIKALVLGRIPFSNIVEYDLDGDEYCPMPHVYCTFACDGTPYEGYRSVRLDGDIAHDLPTDKQVNLGRPAGNQAL